MQLVLIMIMLSQDNKWSLMTSKVFSFKKDIRKKIQLEHEKSFIENCFNKVLGNIDAYGVKSQWLDINPMLSIWKLFIIIHYLCIFFSI